MDDDLMENDAHCAAEPIPFARVVWFWVLCWYYRLVYLLRGDDRLAWRLRVFLRPRDWMSEAWFLAWGQNRKFE